VATKSVSVETMGVGKKKGGKHWTAAQVSARKKAAESLKRKKKVVLVAPAWLNKKSKAVWKSILKNVEGMELLDILDVHTLAVYCDSVVKYEELSNTKTSLLDQETVKSLQSWARLIAKYADMLGFTPAARVRLVKKIADEEEDEFGSEFD
jgi:P27 family predicted phage terminase small subunit